MTKALLLASFKARDISIFSCRSFTHPLKIGRNQNIFCSPKTSTKFACVPWWNPNLSGPLTNTGMLYESATEIRPLPEPQNHFTGKFSPLMPRLIFNGVHLRSVVLLAILFLQALISTSQIFHFYGETA